MSGIAVTIRDALYTSIETKRGASELAYNGFTLEKTHKPFANRESAELQDGKVYVMSAGFDEMPVVRQGSSTEVNDLPILIFMQRGLSTSNSLDVGDQWLDLLENISDAARDLAVDQSIERLTWLQNRQMKDETGYPFTFSHLRNQAVLELGFTAHYRYFWPPTA